MIMMISCDHVVSINADTQNQIAYISICAFFESNKLSKILWINLQKNATRFIDLRARKREKWQLIFFSICVLRAKL